MSAVVDHETGEIVTLDSDAAEIGQLYTKARTSIVDSVLYSIECGKRLDQKKADLGHGKWLPWLKDNEDVLGFSSRVTAARLIKLANDSEQNVSLATHLEPVQAVAISRQLWGHDNAHGTQGSGVDEWCTPADVIEDVRAVLGTIELDPASNLFAQKRVKAKRYYTIADDALTKQWKAQNVFMNPPYSTGKILAFVKKLCEEVAEGNVQQAILLTNSLTDTEWFHLAERNSAAICFTRGRVKFLLDEEEGKSPTWGQSFFYFGDNAERFREIFGTRGFIR
jgi:phage N-6-adenine-methyltransferase